MPQVPLPEEAVTEIQTARPLPEVTPPSANLLLQQCRQRATEARRRRREVQSASQKERIRARNAELARARRAMRTDQEREYNGELTFYDSNT